MIYVAESAISLSMKTMGERFRADWVNAGFKTATKAADAMGIGYSTYRAHENGQNDYKPEEAAVYARKFNAKASYLLMGEGEDIKNTINIYDTDLFDENFDSANISVKLESGRIPETSIRARLGSAEEAFLVNPLKNSVTISTKVIRDFWRQPDNLLSRLSLAASKIAVSPVFGDSMSHTTLDGDAVFIDTSYRVTSPQLFMQ